VQQVKTKKN